MGAGWALHAMCESALNDTNAQQDGEVQELLLFCNFSSFNYEYTTVSISTTTATVVTTKQHVLLRVKLRSQFSILIGTIVYYIFLLA